MVCNHLQIKKLKLNCWNLRTGCNSTQCNSFFKKRQYLRQKHSRNKRSCLKWEYTRTRSYIFGEYTNKFSESICHILWKWKRELRLAIVPCRIRFESISAFFDFIERDEGWRWGLRSEMKGEGEGWDRRWRVRVTAWDRRDGGWRWRSEMEREARVEIGEMESDSKDQRWRVRRGFLIGDGGWGECWDQRWRVRRGFWIGDGGWGEGFWSEMEGEAKVEIGDRGWGKGFWSEMEGEGDGFRSERWRVRSKMEGDRALQRSGSRVQNVSKEKKKNEGIAQKKLKTNVLWLRVLNAAIALSKKNADITLKNAALDVFYSPTYKTRLHVFSLSPVF